MSEELKYIQNEIRICESMLYAEKALLDCSKTAIEVVDSSRHISFLERKLRILENIEKILIKEEKENAKMERR